MGIWHWLAHEQTSNLATLLGYGIAAAGGGFAYRRWADERRKRRVDLLMDRMRSFGDSPGANNATMMLYSHDRDIPLYDPAEPPERRYVRVTWYEAARALIPVAVMDHTYDPKMSAIRDSFEDFLARLAQVELHIRADLLPEGEARAIVEPWVRRFGLTGRDTKLVRNLRIYIQARRHWDVQRLFQRYGVDLRADVHRDAHLLVAEVARHEWDAVSDHAQQSEPGNNIESVPPANDQPAGDAPEEPLAT